jgi:hypothetical protein
MLVVDYEKKSDTLFIVVTDNGTPQLSDTVVVGLMWLMSDLRFNFMWDKTCNCGLNLA